MPGRLKPCMSCTGVRPHDEGGDVGTRSAGALWADSTLNSNVIKNVFNVIIIEAKSIVDQGHSPEALQPPPRDPWPWASGVATSP